MARQPGGPLFGLPVGCGLPGKLQSDGYSAYPAFAKDKAIELFGCWAHARRGFFEALEQAPKVAGWMIKPDWADVWLGKTTAVEPGRTGLAPSPSRRAQPDGRGTPSSRVPSLASSLPAAKPDGPGHHLCLEPMANPGTVPGPWRSGDR